MASAALLAVRGGSLVGVAATAYALYVELQMAAAKKRDEQYEALCDIHAGSCTAVLGSSYSHILSHWGLVAPGSALDLSNAVMGMLFYVAAAFHDWWLAPLPVNPSLVLLLASSGALAFSAYLAWVLKYILRDFCVVCVTMYVANLCIFAGALFLWFNGGGGGGGGGGRLKQA